MKNYQKFLFVSASLLTSLSAPLVSANQIANSSPLTAMSSEVSVQLEGQVATILYQPTAAQESYTIQHAVWSEEDGQDDLVWYTATDHSAKVDLSQHKGHGKFIIETYLNVNGTKYRLSEQSVLVNKPNKVTDNTASEQTTKSSTSPEASEEQPTSSTPKPDKKQIGDLGTPSQNTEEKKPTPSQKSIAPKAAKPQANAESAKPSQAPAQSQPIRDSKPQISIINIDKENGAYTVQVQETAYSKRIKSVQVASWSTANQSNLLWYEAAQTGKGNFSVHFNVKNHHQIYGNYNNHVYISFEDGSRVGYIADNIDLPQPAPRPVSPSLQVVQKDPSTYQVILQNSFGDGHILFPIWSDINGQDDLRWYTATSLGNGRYSLDINTNNHLGEGLYHVHVYRQSGGKVTGIMASHFQVKRPTVTAGRPISHATDPSNTYPIGECTWGAKALAPWAGNWWGNGGDWAASARRAGFRVGTTPQVGAIACWTDGGYGHVGVVTHVNSHTRIQVQEANYAGNRYIANFRGWFDPTIAQGTVSYIYPN